MPNPIDLAQLQPANPSADAVPKGAAAAFLDADGNRYYLYKYARPSASATVAVQARGRDAWLLVRRAREPHKGQWCFPGGFIETGHETLEGTATREVAEETGIALLPGTLRQIDVRSGPDRDARDHVVDVGFHALAEYTEPKAGDDAAEARWHTAAEVEALELAFDHRELWNAVQVGQSGPQK